MKIELSRLNHILIPSTKEGRDRVRRSRLGRALRPLVRPFSALTAEGRLLALLAILAGAFGLDALRTETHVLFGLLFGVVAASILVSTRFQVPGAGLEVRVPRRVALGEEIVFTVVYSNGSDAPIRAVRLRRPFLPYDGTWTGGSSTMTGISPGKRGQTELRARFEHRGDHHLDPFGAGALVPFGLAMGRPAESEGVRFTVIPRIAPVARLPLPLGRRFQPGGVALASKLGDSAEFLGVRPYRPGDPVRDLHARTSARAGAPVVRERQQEYFSRVGVVLDTDPRAATPHALEAALSLAAGVVAHLSRGEALIDLLVVGSQVHELTLGRSLGHMEQALDLLACVEGGPALAPDELLAHLAPHLPRLSCLVFVALTWDEGRRTFAESVRAQGVGFRALLVGEGDVGEATAVSIAAVERGEALSL